jgi:hypothetical protein
MDAIFEQKEYSESYVMEGEARQLIAGNPALADEFEKKKIAEPAFAADPDAILNWFYSKTPYWDQHVNLYPIGRLMDPEILRSFSFLAK